MTATFANEGCDREILVWCAWEGKGLPGEPVREMLIKAVEKCCGTVKSVPGGHTPEFLSDNGGADIATQTRQMTRALGLKPINTPVCSLQGDGMAESCVNTFRRDYLSRMDLSDAPAVMRQLPAAFEHFNEMYPHLFLKIKSPREFRRNQTAKQFQNQPAPSASNCVKNLSGHTGGKISSTKSLHHLFGKAPACVEQRDLLAQKSPLC